MYYIMSKREKDRVHCENYDLKKYRSGGIHRNSPKTIFRKIITREDGWMGIHGRAVKGIEIFQ